MTQELAHTLNIDVEISTSGLCRVRMPAAGALQPYGIVHGGANAVLVEHAGSILAMSNAPEGRVPVGSELSVSQLAPNTSGAVIAEARVIKAGRSSLTSDVKVFDEAGELTAVGRLTCVFIQPKA